MHHCICCAMVCSGRPRCDVKSKARASELRCSWGPSSRTGTLLGRGAPMTPGQDFARTDFAGRVPARPLGPGPLPRGRLLKAGRGRRRRRSWSYFVGQPWPRWLLHRSAGECGAPAGRSGAADGARVSAQAWPGARRAAACPRVATPGRAPGGRPTTTGCCGGPGCSDRGAAPAAGPGPLGVGSTPTPDP